MAPRSRLRGLCPWIAVAAAGGGCSPLELLVAITVTSLLLALAMPTVSDWLRVCRQLNPAQAQARSLDLARSEAVKRNGRINLCKTADRHDGTRHGGWGSG
jgi:type IV fimbrial biogenesis protein FimT